MDNNSKLFGVILVPVLREGTSLNDQSQGWGCRGWWGGGGGELTLSAERRWRLKETIGVLLVGFQYSQYYTVWLPWDLNLQRWNRRASKEWGTEGSVEQQVLGKGFLNAFLDQDTQYRKYQTKPDGNLSLNLFVCRTMWFTYLWYTGFFFFISKTRLLNCISCLSLL